MKKSRLAETFELIKKLRPMISIDKLDEYEKIHGLGHFDVWFKQKDDRKTVWGDSQIRWNDTTLRSLAGNIYDYLYDNYEMWIRETPTIKNESTTMSDENIRYAISLEADNLSDDFAPLDCRMISGWLVMSAYYDATFNQKKKFFVEFGYTEPFKLGPSRDDAEILSEQEMENIVNEKIKIYDVVSICNKKFQCSHCTEEHEWQIKRLEVYGGFDFKELNKQYDEVIEIEKYWLHEKKRLTIEKFQERYDQVIKLKKEIEKYIYERDNTLSELVNIENRKLYRCNVCKTVFCSLRMRLRRVCIDCAQEIEDDIVSKKKG